MDSRVPLGMAEVGSLRSPLMLAPATMPVTAVVMFENLYPLGQNKLECLSLAKIISKVMY
jgi:hypothetical protein